MYDDVQLIYKKKSQAERWKNQEVVELSEIDPLPWGLAVRREEKNRDWGRFMADVVGSWLRSDQLLTLERKWLGKNTPWLSAVHMKMQASTNRR